MRLPFELLPVIWLTACAQARPASTAVPLTPSASAPRLVASTAEASRPTRSDDRARVLALLDAIDRDVDAITREEMRGLPRYADSIRARTDELAEPIEAFPAAASLWQELHRASERFSDVARTGGHDEKHHLQDRIGELTARIRGAL